MLAFFGFFTTYDALVIVLAFFFKKKFIVLFSVPRVKYFFSLRSNTKVGSNTKYFFFPF